MKLYLTKDDRQYLADISSQEFAQPVQTGGTFGERSTVIYQKAVEHRLEISIPVRVVMVSVASDDDPATVIETLFAAFEEVVDEYERRNG